MRNCFVPDCGGRYSNVIKLHRTKYIQTRTSETGKLKRMGLLYGYQHPGCGTTTVLHDVIFRECTQVSLDHF